MGIKLTIDESVFDYEKGKIVLEEGDGKTVGECLNYAVKQLPELQKAIFDESGNIGLGNFVKVNMEFIYPNPLVTLVKDGDTIEIVSFTGG